MNREFYHPQNRDERRIPALSIYIMVLTLDKLHHETLALEQVDACGKMADVYRKNRTVYHAGTQTIAHQVVKRIGGAKRQPLYTHL